MSGSKFVEAWFNLMGTRGRIPSAVCTPDVIEKMRQRAQHLWDNPGDNYQYLWLDSICRASETLRKEDLWHYLHHPRSEFFSKGGAPASPISLDDSMTPYYFRLPPGTTFVREALGIKKPYNRAIKPEEITEHREGLLRDLSLDPDEGMISVVGDSAIFGAGEKTRAAQKFIDKQLSPLALTHPVIYGWTGREIGAGEDYRSETNNLVSQWAKQQRARGQRVCLIGNAVDFHTPLAMLLWGCTVGTVDRLILVFTSEVPEARFGDDVAVSDFILPPRKSKMLALEGGPQTLLQIRNMLLQNIPIVGLIGLRDEDNGRYHDPAEKDLRPEARTYPYQYFSATQFLLFVREVLITNPEITAEALKAQIYADYLHDPSSAAKFPEDRSKRLYANPFAKDFLTKKALWDEAMPTLFDDKELFKKLPELLTVYVREGSEYRLIPVGAGAPEIHVGVEHPKDELSITRTPVATPFSDAHRTPDTATERGACTGAGHGGRASPDDSKLGTPKL